MLLRSLKHELKLARESETFDKRHQVSGQEQPTQDYLIFKQKQIII